MKVMKHQLNQSGAEFVGHFQQCHAWKINKITKMHAKNIKTRTLRLI